MFWQRTAINDPLVRQGKDHTARISSDNGIIAGFWRGRRKHAYEFAVGIGEDIAFTWVVGIQDYEAFPFRSVADHEGHAAFAVEIIGGLIRNDQTILAEKITLPLRLASS